MEKLFPYTIWGSILYVILVFVIEIPIVCALFNIWLYMKHARKYASRERKRMVRQGSQNPLESVVPLSGNDQIKCIFLATRDMISPKRPTNLA